ncbi:MAG: B12-binding domain-containing protein, partial [Chloroflexi bacterium]|nr:B12-binding domain-containing protein [Chloroflexota bacterium]
DELIFNKSQDALPDVIAFYEDSVDTAERESKVDPTEGMTLHEKIHWQIVHRKKEGIEELIDESVKGEDAVWILNNVLLPAMKEVGDKFGSGELILPFVLQSAEVMKKAVAQLENYLEKKEGSSKGTVILATVFGDVHDIGKNLVGTILGNNGYDIVDLGKRIPVNNIIDAALEHDAVAIGLSALLVNTSKQMPICIQELHKRGLGFPVLVGGAAIHRRFGYRILFMDDGRAYDPGVFYCKDAFEGLDVVDKLIGPDASKFLEGLKEKGSLMIVPSSALDSMNLGAIGGLASLGMHAEKIAKAGEEPMKPDEPEESE